MRRQATLIGGWTAAVALAVGVPWGLQAVNGQVARPAPQASQIPSLSEPGEGLTVRDASERTGLVRFASTDGNGILVSVQPNAPSETRARSFIGLYGAAFGVTNQSLELGRPPEVDSLGIEHVRFRQTHQGVPVAAGELLVHLRGSRILAVNGETLPEAELPDVTPRIGADDALASARVLLSRQRPSQDAGVQFSSPRLEILNRGLLEGGIHPSHLTWFVEATGGPALREFIWVDASRGGIVLHFNQATNAKSRQIYDANGGATLPGTLKRGEGGPATGDPEEDGLYTLLGATYDYFSTQHSRDSFNGAGGTIIGSVDWFESGNCPNAFWNGTQTVYCDGLANEDVVHHEFTHAVTEFTAGLFYFNQSGALNESFSDIFGETVDLTDGLGLDTPAVRWQIGENTGIGVIRNMMTPTLFGDPGKMSDPQYICSPLSDLGGVHINSGIANHAYALMVDGGSYNGHTMTGIGLTKAGKIQYRALSVYLAGGSNFLDNFNAVRQSCTDLVGTSGITTSDCTQVVTALKAVEMDRKPICSTYTSSPALCPTGAPPVSTAFLDDFETFPNPNWGISSTSGVQWAIGNFWGKGGLGQHAWGEDASITSAHNLTQVSPVMIPANARMHFEHAFFFEFNGGTTYWDGGIIEYSTNAGTSWNSAQPLIEAGQTYNGTLVSGTPLGAVPAFVGDSAGFTGTRLNLSSLAGQSVIFRFRIGTDLTGAYYGWSVDNVRVYTCAGDPGGNMVQNGTFSSGGSPPTPPANWMVFSTGTAMVWNTTGGTFNYQRPAGNTQGVVFQQTGVPIPAFGAVEATLTMANTDPVRKRFSVLLHDSNFADLTVCTFWLDALAPTRSFTMRSHTTQSWANATISIYAASVGSGGFYQLDGVTLTPRPAQSPERTDCVDPVAPAAGGLTSGELISNGSFTSVVTPWGPFGNIAWQLSGGVFEFFKLAGQPSAVVLQTPGVNDLRPADPMVNDQKLFASFQLGNSSALRQRVTVLIHASDFSDLHACTYYLPPGLPLSTFGMRTYATKPWTNWSFSVYPATVGTAPSNQWLRLDNVSMARSNVAAFGTECYEPGDVPGSFAGVR